MRSAVAVILATSIACGARTDAGRFDVDAARGDGNEHGDAAPSGPCVAAGVRVCGGGCPALGPECAGYGCTPVIDRTTFTPFTIGVCWADLGPEILCDACKDGEVCVQRAPDRLVCAPLALCEKLSAIGAGAACRYADKSAYDRRPLALPSGQCPSNVEAAVCGGSCGPCPNWTLDRCFGRSPGRPWGACPYTVSYSNGGDPRDVNGCAVDASGKWVRGCALPTILNGPHPKEPARCLVFDVALVDMPAAQTWGLCSPQSVCKARAAATGATHCYRDDGFDDR